MPVLPSSVRNKSPSMADISISVAFFLPPLSDLASQKLWSESIEEEIGLIFGFYCGGRAGKRETPL